jgi:anti-anti-sigma regulatory factor
MNMAAAFDAMVLTAPERVVSDTRAEFRKIALDFVERASTEESKAAAIDLSGTAEVDASGLGILVLVQKRARELGVHLTLRKVPTQVRYLLLLTKLDHLFEFAD